MRILVVGNGIAGSMFTRHARAAGHTVTVLASPTKPRASEAAVCILRRSWFHTPRTLAAVDYAIDLYRNEGWLIETSEIARSYRHNNTRTRTGSYGINPLDPLIPADEIGDWEPGSENGYDATILCRGAAGTDLDWRRLWGATSLLHRPNGWPQIQSYEERPRFSTYALDVGTIRFGSTSALDETTTLRRQGHSERMARSAGVLPAGPTDHLTGIRLMPPDLDRAGELRRFASATFAIEGFGRVGYSLAPYTTREHLNTIERQLTMKASP